MAKKMVISENKVKGPVCRAGRAGGRGAVWICAALFAAAFFTAFLMGNYPVPPGKLLPILLHKPLGFLHGCIGLAPAPEASWPAAAETAVVGIRLPRVLAAALIGGGLSAAGLCYQGIFRNPMASPDILGASAGAGFGAALGLYFSLPRPAITSLAFFTGLLAVAAARVVGGRVRGSPVTGLVLSGIVISSLFSSGTSFLKLAADPDDTLPAITYWLMGGLSSVWSEDLLPAAVPAGIGCAALLLLGWRLNILTFGEEEARSMGVDTRRVRGLAILASTLITAACVSVSGLIGWVGLVVPHFVRMLFGCDYRSGLPCSLFLGGGFLILVDDLARTLSTGEIPLGILTSFVGAPFFIYLILREGKRP